VYTDCTELVYSSLDGFSKIHNYMELLEKSKLAEEEERIGTRTRTRTTTTTTRFYTEHNIDTE
jgi:hypothetical protein